MKKTLLLLSFLVVTGSQAVAQCPAGQSEVTMSVSTDRYGDETTWDITGPGGTPVYASGGPYTFMGSNGVYPQTPVVFCVPDGAVMMISVEDTYGDGMCCAYGAGGWTVSIDGITAASGGTFEDVETATVVVGTDLGLATLGVANVIAQGNTTINGTVSNNGITAISSFTLAYSVDGGTPIPQTFNSTVAAGGTYTFTHSTPWNATMGPHALVLTLSGVGGDLVAANNTMSSTVNVATQSVQRTTLMEQFTSSTCGPCASMNVTWAPTLESVNTNMVGSNVSAVKYHMNWPSPGNDPSYNPDANTRKTYYGVSAIPDRFLDGDPLNSTSASTLNAAAAVPAFVALNAQATIGGNLVTVNVDLTPYAAFSGAHKLFVAVVEHEYDYAASTTNQDVFHYVQRKMLPNGNGTTLSTMAAGVGQDFTFSYSFVVGNPAQGNYNLWTSMDNLDIVAFIQNTATKEILQANIASIAVGVEENLLGQRLRVYPNPTNGTVNVQFEAAGSGTAFIEVYNVLGECVFQANRAMSSGTQREILDLSSFDNGLYFVNITADGMRASRKVTLNK